LSSIDDGFSLESSSVFKREMGVSIALYFVWATRDTTWTLFLHESVITWIESVIKNKLFKLTICLFACMIMCDKVRQEIMHGMLYLFHC